MTDNTINNDQTMGVRQVYGVSGSFTSLCKRMVYTFEPLSNALCKGIVYILNDD